MAEPGFTRRPIEPPALWTVRYNLPRGSPCLLPVIFSGSGSRRHSMTMNWVIAEEEKSLPKAPSIGTYTWKDAVTMSVVVSASRLAVPAESRAHRGRRHWQRLCLLASAILELRCCLNTKPDMLTCLARAPTLWPRLERSTARSLPNRTCTRHTCSLLLASPRHRCGRSCDSGSYMGLWHGGKPSFQLPGDKT